MQLQKKRKYHSYKGNIGIIADNVLNRNFSASKPYEKLGTDLTEFNVLGTKVYFSPIVDFYTREILAYNISYHPNFKQIENMFKDLVKKHGDKVNGAILHSDQGWQYQMKKYQQILKKLGIIQSMSRKGNCLDNSPTENLFGRIKAEMFYDNEFMFANATEFIAKLEKYINYYNYERIVYKIRSSPVEFRTCFYGAS